VTTGSADTFVATIVGFEGLPVPIQSDLLALYLLTGGGAAFVGSATTASLRIALRLPAHKRLPAYLSEKTRKRGKAKPLYVKVKEGYVLERGYAARLEQEYLGRPVTRHLATSLRGTLAAIGDPAIKSYLEEAIAAFEHDHRRAALILTWCVAYGLVRDWMFRNHLAALNTAMAAWKYPIQIAKLDDFQDLTESTVLDTARKAAMLSREQHKTLKGLLDLRNSFAHPTTKPITPAMVEAYIDTVIREVLPAFG
jgi:hypothetical protein